MKTIVAFLAPLAGRDHLGQRRMRSGSLRGLLAAVLLAGLSALSATSPVQAAGFYGASGGGGTQATGPVHPGYVAGPYYAPIGAVNDSNTGGVPSVATMVCSPGAIGGTAPVKILNLLARILTAGTTTFQVGVYTNDTTTFNIARPGALVGTSAQIANTSTGPVIMALSGGPFTEPPGFYWFCMQQGDTTARYTSKGAVSSDSQMLQTIGGSSTTIAIASNNISGVSTVVSGYGTFPATFVGVTGTTWTEIGVAAPAMRFSVSN